MWTKAWAGLYEGRTACHFLKVRIFYQNMEVLLFTFWSRDWTGQHTVARMKTFQTSQEERVTWVLTWLLLGLAVGGWGRLHPVSCYLCSDPGAAGTQIRILQRQPLDNSCPATGDRRETQHCSEVLKPAAVPVADGTGRRKMYNPGNSNSLTLSTFRVLWEP
jgi:hypothetical protein